MASKHFEGQLLEPIGDAASNDKLRFTHTSTTGQTIGGAQSVVTIDAAGFYNFDLEYGIIQVEYFSETANRWRVVGSVTINSDITATTITALLNAVTPATPELVLELQQILADADQIIVDAQASADAASQSATDAANSAVENGKVIKAILVSEGLSGEYGYFADGFTLNDPLDVGIDASFQFWKYAGAETLPYAVPAGTDPSAGDWVQVIYDQVVKGGVEIKTPTVNPDTHMLFQPVDDVPIRVHWEPKGYIDNGVVSKFDMMGQPYDLDPVNYNIWNLYLTNGDPHGTGEGTVIAFNAKGVGSNWGLWPSINFGFQDLGANAVCSKMWYGDHNQPEHFTPNKGNWREGKSFTAGDYATNNNDVFRAATTGVAGNTPPTHTSGTVSDGNIDWEFIYSPNFNTVRATFMFGDRADMPVLGHADCRAQFRRNYLTAWGAQHKWLNSDGDMIFRFLASATSGGANEWMHFETFGGGYERWHRTENYKQTIGLAITESAVTYNSGETNLDLSGVTLINFGNTVATTVSTISNVKPNQLIKLESANGNTTIANSSTIRLIGNQNVTLNERTAIFLIADTSGTFLKQVGHESGNYKPVSVPITYNDLWGDADADPANSVQCLNDRGVVSLSGRADPNASPSTQIGTLPTGYRPVDRDAFVVTCDDAGSIVRLQFTTSGQILTNSIQDGIAFDGVTFVVDR